jgi:holliday junction DNA helicase RuvA
MLRRKEFGMISRLQGSISTIDHHRITLDVHGVGYDVQVAHPEGYATEQLVTVYIYSHWNAESGPQLFGFSNTYEKELFSTLLDCQGIGPKLALNILSQMNPTDFITAITLNNIKLLSSLKGIGPKKAETIMVQLHDKIKKLDVSHAPAGNEQSNEFLISIKSVSDALSYLSYSRAEIASAMDFVKNNAVPSSTFDELMRKALAHLAKTK